MTVKYNKVGQEIQDGDYVFAEEINGSRQTIYKILTYNNSIYDPRGADSHREKTLNRTLRRTTKKTFEYYLQYLQTKNPVFLRRAERSFINE